MGLIKVLGKIFNFKKEDRISVIDNKVSVEDKVVTNCSNDPVVNIEGDIKVLTVTSGNIRITGNVGTINSCSDGNIQIKGNVRGKIYKANGDVTVNKDE